MTRSSCRQKSTCCSERMERAGRWWSWWRWRRLRGGWCGLRLCAYLNKFHIKMQDINLKLQPADEESHAAFFLLCISTAIKTKKNACCLNFRQQLDSFEWQFNYANYYQSLPSVHRHRPPRSSACRRPCGGNAIRRQRSDDVRNAARRKTCAPPN